MCFDFAGGHSSEDGFDGDDGDDGDSDNDDDDPTVHPTAANLHMSDDKSTKRAALYPSFLSMLKVNPERRVGGKQKVGSFVEPNRRQEG